MLKTLFLFTMLNVLMGIQAQTEDLPLLKMKGSQFGIRNTLSPGIDYTKPDLRALMPNSTLLIQDLTDFRESGPSVNADNVDFEYLIKLSVKNKLEEPMATEESDWVQALGTVTILADLLTTDKI